MRCRSDGTTQIKADLAARAVPRLGEPGVPQVLVIVRRIRRGVRAERQLPRPSNIHEGNRPRNAQRGGLETMIGGGGGGGEYIYMYTLIGNDEVLACHLEDTVKM